MAVFPVDTWNRRHLQIIYFGREHCPALRHDLTTCPICSWAATKKRIHAESKLPGRSTRRRTAG
jgi:endonuclease-3